MNLNYNLNKNKFLNDQNRVSSNQIIIIESGSAEVWVDINHFYAKPNSIFLFSEGQIQKFVERKNEIVRTVEAAKKTFGNDIFPSGQFSPLMRVPHTYNSK